MKNNPFRYFNSSPEVIRLAVMMYIRYPLSLRQVEDLLFERGIDICHETVRYWWKRSLFGSTARDITFGAPSTTKARCSKRSSQGGEIAERRSSFSSAR